MIPSDKIKRHSYFKFQKHLREETPERSHLTSYHDFNVLNSKSGFITVRETWTRMLLCIKGVSPEKAGAIILKFPTCVSMYKACLKAQKQEEEDEADEEVERKRSGKVRKKKDVFLAKHFLKDVGGNTGRMIGLKLSERIYRMMMDEVYEPGDFGADED